MGHQPMGGGSFCTFSPHGHTTKAPQPHSHRGFLEELGELLEGTRTLGWYVSRSAIHKPWLALR